QEVIVITTSGHFEKFHTCCSSVKCYRDRLAGKSSRQSTEYFVLHRICLRGIKDEIGIISALALLKAASDSGSLPNRSLSKVADEKRNTEISGYVKRNQ